MQTTTNYTLYSDVARQLKAVGGFSFLSPQGEVLCVPHGDNVWKGYHYSDMLESSLTGIPVEKIAERRFPSW